MKICPICKSRCFDDMKICYGCLHQFKTENYTADKKSNNLNKRINKNYKNSNKNKNTKKAENVSNKTFECETMHIHNLNVKNVDICKDFHIPEYFEIESFPYIEEETLNHNEKDEFLNTTQNFKNVDDFKIKNIDDTNKIRISFTINKEIFLTQIQAFKKNNK